VVRLDELENVFVAEVELEHVNALDFGRQTKYCGFRNIRDRVDNFDELVCAVGGEIFV
jgi:hypothetical protein